MDSYSITEKRGRYHGSFFFFLISKKKILLIKEKQEKHKEFTVVNKGKRNNKTKTAPNLF